MDATNDSFAATIVSMRVDEDTKKAAGKPFPVCLLLFI